MYFIIFCNIFESELRLKYFSRNYIAFYWSLFLFLILVSNFPLFKDIQTMLLLIVAVSSFCCWKSVVMCVVLVWGKTISWLFFSFGTWKIRGLVVHYNERCFGTLISCVDELSILSHDCFDYWIYFLLLLH